MLKTWAKKLIQSNQNYTCFKYFVRIVSLLNKHYSSESDIEDIDDDYIVDFINRNQIEIFQQLYEETEVKYLRYFKNSKENFQKTVVLKINGISR